MNLPSLLPTLTTKQISQLEQLADLFLDWNKKLNLSSIRTRDGILLKHIVDSLLILKYNWIKDGDRILDLGTGGGFPGLALAITYPQVKFVLIDATAKKIKAVQAMANELNLKNVQCLVGRAEELGSKDGRKAVPPFKGVRGSGRSHPCLREGFDIVVARALASLPTLLEYCLPFVKVGGKLVAYQGPELAKEWKKYKSIAEKLSSGIIDVKETMLPIENAKRCFVVLKKMRRISKKYPRGVGIPKKKPL